MACKYYINNKVLNEQEIKEYISSNYIKESDIKLTTLGDIADILAYSNSKLILDGYTVEYTTPDNMKFKTYQEASNHISELAKSVKDVDLDSVKINTETPEEQKRQIKQFTEELKDLRNQFNNFKFEKIPFNNKIDIYTEKGRLRQNYWARREDGTTGYLGGSKETLTGDDYDGFVLDKRGDPNAVQNREYIKISDDEAKKIFDEVNDTNTATRASIDIYNALARNIDVLENRLNALEEGSPLKNFISKNKEYEQSKEIIEEWKKVNNIQYNPEEIYSRGQGFYHSIGAYSNHDLELILQNILEHFKDNNLAGGTYDVSAFTKPTDKTIRHIEKSGVLIEIFPESKDINWASNIDVFSGSTLETHEKFSGSKLKKELAGVSESKYPSLSNINTIQPNLANIIDELNHDHNELGITLTGKNFRFAINEKVLNTDTPDGLYWKVKKLVDANNKILDQKYGKLSKPDTYKNKNQVGVNKNTTITYSGEVLEEFGGSSFWINFENGGVKEFSTEQELVNFVNNLSEKTIYINTQSSYKGIQPTQTNETLKESIGGVKKKILSPIHEQYGENPNKEAIEADYKDGIITKEQRDSILNGKEYTEQALINTKIAALKEVAKKYPRSLIRSEVKRIENYENYVNVSGTKGLFDPDELPFQKIPNYLSKEQSDAIDNVFDENPELAKIGSKEQYSQYLESLNKPNTNPILQGNQANIEEIITQLEKEGLLEIDCKGKLKAEKGLATAFTKGGKWKVIKDLKGYPTHKEGGVDLTISKDGVSIKNGNTQFTAKYGLVIPKN